MELALRHDPPELWFRERSGDGVLTGMTTRTLRLGRRDAKHLRGYALGELVLIKCLDASGAERYTRWAHVNSIVVKLLQDIHMGDCEGCPDDERRAPREHLERCYGRPLGGDEEVSIIGFAYETTSLP